MVFPHFRLWMSHLYQKIRRIKMSISVWSSTDYPVEEEVVEEAPAEEE